MPGQAGAFYGKDCEPAKTNRGVLPKPRCGAAVFLKLAAGAGLESFQKALAPRRRKAEISCDRDHRRPVACKFRRGSLWRFHVASQTTPKARYEDPPGGKQGREEERSLQYLQSGFGNHFVSEAVPGALPVGRNSPQRPPHGLYAEQISGTSFTTPRAENRRTWTYRIQPSVVHRPYARTDNGMIRSAPFHEVDATPTQLRWSPLPIPKKPTDFVEGIVSLGGNGDVTIQVGMAIHIYAANRSMTDRCFYNADGEMLIVPQHGRARFVTELGVVEAAPGEIVIIPRGLRFRTELPDGPSRGYICENYGAMLRLPELGPLGANGLANPRDFLAPVAAYEDTNAPCALVTKFQGNLWTAEMDHSPLNVVAWHGNFAPYKYDLARFMTIGTVSFDHPDPSIFSVLTAPSDLPGAANIDFVIFPPRWLVGEDTFRPPWFHRNVMTARRVHGTLYRRLRRQGGRLPARRRQPAQLHDRARPRRRDLGTGLEGAIEAAQDRGHHGVHVREPLRHAAHALCGGIIRAAARLFRRLARVGETLFGVRSGAVARTTGPAHCRGWFRDRS